MRQSIYAMFIKLFTHDFDFSRLFNSNTSQIQYVKDWKMNDDTPLFSSLSTQESTEEDFSPKSIFDDDEEEEENREKIKIQPSFLESDSQNSFLKHEMHVVNHSESLSEFLVSLSQLLGINETDEVEMMNKIKEKVTFLVNKSSGVNTSGNYSKESTTSSKISTESVGFLIQNKKLLEKRIAELEEETKENHELLNIMEKELETMKKESNEHENERQQLEDILQQFCAASGFPHSVDEALKHIKEYKDQNIFYEAAKKDQNIDTLFQQIKYEQMQALNDIQRAIDAQSKIVLQYQKRIENATKPKVKEDLIQSLCSNIESTNELLQQRMCQLKEENENRSVKSESSFQKIPAQKERKARTPQRPISRKLNSLIENDDENSEIKHSIWLAKTREMLALERMVDRMDTEYNTNASKVRYMTTENILMHQRKKELNDDDLGKSLSIVYPGTIL